MKDQKLPQCIDRCTDILRVLPFEAILMKIVMNVIQDLRRFKSLER